MFENNFELLKDLLRKFVYEKPNSLDKLYELRYEELSETTEDEKDFMRINKIESTKAASEMIRLINSLPEDTAIRNELLEAHYFYLDEYARYNSYHLQKYYTSGFFDGFSLLLDILLKRNES